MLQATNAKEYSSDQCSVAINNIIAILLINVHLGYVLYLRIIDVVACASVRTWPWP